MLNLWWYAGTVSVIILYDQSGNGNHANSGSNLTLTLYSGKYIILSSAANSSLMNMTTAVSPSSLSLLFQFSDTGTWASGIHTIISTSQDYSLRLVSAITNTLFGVNNLNDFLYENSVILANNVVNYVNGTNTTVVTFSTTASPVFNACGVSIASAYWICHFVL